jgi:hypothetical protein
MGCQLVRFSLSDFQHYRIPDNTSDANFLNLGSSGVRVLRMKQKRFNEYNASPRRRT